MLHTKRAVTSVGVGVRKHKFEKFLFKNVFDKVGREHQSSEVNVQYKFKPLVEDNSVK